MKNDAASNDLIANNDVFADILNGNQIFGDYRILPEDLADIPVEGTFKDLDGGMRKLGRDIFKEVSKLGVHIMMIGFENQTDINNVMPVRDMGYAYTAYMRQIRQMIVDNKLQGNSAYTKVLHDDQKLKPVLTFVLYFGKKEWKKPLSLMDMLDIPENQKEMIGKYIPDYQIYVIPMRNQPEEVRKRYQSDFAVIADALAYQGKGKKEIKEYLKNDKRVLYHAEQTLNLLSTISGSKVAKLMYEHYTSNMFNQEEEETTMADVFEDIFEDFYEDIKKKLAEVDQMKAEVERQKAEVERQKAEVDQQKAEVDQQKAESDKQKAEADQQKAEADQQKAEADQQKAELDQQKAEADQQKAELDQQKAELDQQKAEADQYEAEINQMKAEADQHEAEINQKKAELDQHEAEINQKKAELDQHEAEINQKKAELDQHEAEVNQKKAEVALKEQTLTEQKFKIIKSLIAVWDIPTISENMGCSIEEIKKIVDEENCTV